MDDLLAQPLADYVLRLQASTRDELDKTRGEITRVQNTVHLGGSTAAALIALETRRAALEEQLSVINSVQHAAAHYSGGPANEPGVARYFSAISSLLPAESSTRDQRRVQETVMQIREEKLHHQRSGNDLSGREYRRSSGLSVLSDVAAAAPTAPSTQHASGRQYRAGDPHPAQAVAGSVPDGAAESSAPSRPRSAQPADAGRTGSSGAVANHREGTRRRHNVIPHDTTDDGLDLSMATADRGHAGLSQAPPLPARGADGASLEPPPGAAAARQSSSGGASVRWDTLSAPFDGASGVSWDGSAKAPRRAARAAIFGSPVLLPSMRDSDSIVASSFLGTHTVHLNAALASPVGGMDRAVGTGLARAAPWADSADDNLSMLLIARHDLNRRHPSVFSPRGIGDSTDSAAQQRTVTFVEDAHRTQPAARDTGYQLEPPPARRRRPTADEMASVASSGGGGRSTSAVSSFFPSVTSAAPLWGPASMNNYSDHMPMVPTEVTGAPVARRVTVPTRGGRGRGIRRAHVDAARNLHDAHLHEGAAAQAAAGDLTWPARAEASRRPSGVQPEGKPAQGPLRSAKARVSQTRTASGNAEARINAGDPPPPHTSSAWPMRGDATFDDTGDGGEQASKRVVRPTIEVERAAVQLIQTDRLPTTNEASSVQVGTEADMHVAARDYPSHLQSHQQRPQLVGGAGSWATGHFLVPPTGLDPHGRVNALSLGGPLSSVHPAFRLSAGAVYQPTHLPFQQQATLLPTALPLLQPTSQLQPSLVPPSTMPLPLHTQHQTPPQPHHSLAHQWLPPQQQWLPGQGLPWPAMASVPGRLDAGAMHVLRPGYFNWASASPVVMAAQRHAVEKHPHHDTSAPPPQQSQQPQPLAPAPGSTQFVLSPFAELAARHLPPSSSTLAPPSDPANPLRTAALLPLRVVAARPVGPSVTLEAVDGVANNATADKVQPTAAAHDAVLWVNRLQLTRILRMRERREWINATHGPTILGGPRRPFRYESRHAHALRRPRHPSGRFYTKDEIAALKLASVSELSGSMVPADVQANRGAVRRETSKTTSHEDSDSDDDDNSDQDLSVTSDAEE